MSQSLETNTQTVPPAASLASGDESERFADDLTSYQAVSKSAVLALILGLLSAVALAAPSFVFVPAMGIVFGIVAIMNLRRYPDELTGKPLALFGLTLSSLMLVAGCSWHAYVYATEVPDGFTRASFYELRPDRNHPELPIPPAAIEMHGKRVFIKGYVHPSVASVGPVDEFLLVPDMGTCCFGGQPKLTDMIKVKLTNGLSLEYSYRRRALAGTFEIDPNIIAPDGSQGPCYKLVAEYLQ